MALSPNASSQRALARSRKSSVVTIALALSAAIAMLVPGWYLLVHSTAEDLQLFGANLQHPALPSNHDCRAVDPSIVIYNRLPKCGSTTMKHLVHELAARNHFSDLLTDFEGSDSSVVNRSVKVIHRHAKHLVRRGNASRAEHRRYPKRAMFVQHVSHFPLDVGSVSTAWVNLARHPIELTQSWWYYMVDPTVRPLGRAEATMLKRKNETCGCSKLTFNECVLSAPQRRCESENLQLMDVELKYFCGTHPECNKDTERRYQMAVQTLRTEYVFVGLTERMELSMKVFERLLPRYFRHAGQLIRQPSVVGKITTPYPELSWQAAKMLVEYPGNNYILRFWRDIEHLFWEKVRNCGLQ